MELLKFIAHVKSGIITYIYKDPKLNDECYGARTDEDICWAANRHLPAGQQFTSPEAMRNRIKGRTEATPEQKRVLTWMMGERAERAYDVQGALQYVTDRLAIEVTENVRKDRILSRSIPILGTCAIELVSLALF